MPTARVGQLPNGRKSAHPPLPSPGINIQYTRAFSLNKDGMKNCVDVSGTDMPWISEADGVSYQVTGVEYTDGTSWSASDTP